MSIIVPILVAIFVDKDRDEDRDEDGGRTKIPPRRAGWDEDRDNDGGSAERPGAAKRGKPCFDMACRVAYNPP